MSCRTDSNAKHNFHLGNERRISNARCQSNSHRRKPTVCSCSWSCFWALLGALARAVLRNSLSIPPASSSASRSRRAALALGTSAEYTAVRTASSLRWMRQSEEFVETNFWIEGFQQHPDQSRYGECIGSILFLPVDIPAKKASIASAAPDLRRCEPSDNRHLVSYQPLCMQLVRRNNSVWGIVMIDRSLTCSLISKHVKSAFHTIRVIPLA